QVAHVETEWPIDGRKRFKGDIMSVEDGKLTLRLDAKHNVTIDIDGIQNAKLALTEELVRQYLSKRKQSESEV
ncbi:MAG: ribosome maturation factor RimP, partial [Alphaproteobacteria bacterium]|nr:ribosome maturation factor RimP [Alphaproteobacteria bacterium]